MLDFHQAPGWYFEGDEYYGTGFLDEHPASEGGPWRVRCLLFDPHEAPHARPEAALAQAAFKHQRAAIAAPHKDYLAGALSFELLNEPHGSSWREGGVDQGLNPTGPRLRAVFAPMIDTIRAASPARPIFVNGADYGARALPEFETLDVAQSRHEYRPFIFNHLNASWVEADFTGSDNLAWPDTNRFGADAIRDNPDKMQPWTVLRDAGVPVLTESGCYDTVPNAPRLAYLSDMLAMFATTGMPWYYWCLEDDFGLFDSERTNPATTRTKRDGTSVYDPTTRVGSVFGKRVDLDLLDVLKGG